MAEDIAAPALGYSILANLGDEKQLTVQCFVDSEESLPSIHAKLDKAMAVVDRQKAKYRLKDLAKELAETEAALGRQQDDLARIEDQFVAGQEARAEQVRQLAEAREEIAKAAYGKGRSGPVGHDKQRSEALKKQIEHLREEGNKAEAERAQARQNMAVNIGRFNDHIEKLAKQIDECNALITGDGS
jgi:DNA repair exonuclease SbcCD ATPase subunit